MKTTIKLVLIILTICMMQLAYTIFFYSYSDDTIVDAIIRTAIAAMFGYLLSSDFAKKRIIIHGKSRSLQEFVIFSICLTSLLLLILVKNLNLLNSDNILNIGQIRDMFSGSVGFLIGTNGDHAVDQENMPPSIEMGKSQIESDYMIHEPMSSHSAESSQNE